MSKIKQPVVGENCAVQLAVIHFCKRRPCGARQIAAWSFLLIAITGLAGAQVNIVTEHNDIARTGQNLSETILTPANVSAVNSFGKLFSQTISGHAVAQPLYVAQVTIPGKGVHNVVYVATDTDHVYAFDADTNGGVDASPLWQVTLTTNTTPAGTYTAQFGINGTPVIDLTSNTIYLVSSENQGSNSLFRLHALDITTGAEKFGGPFQIQATLPGTGTGSSAGVLTFNPSAQRQRSSLLLLNGVLYVSFASINDVGPWHGWLFSFNASTLQEIDVWCTAPNGSGDGIWMGGSGLSAEVNNPANPYGRMFFATGNGSYAVSQPYTRTMSYGMSVVDLDLTAGVFTIEDVFTPYNVSQLDAQNADLGSGGTVLLPTQTTAAGTTFNPLVEVGKSGMVYMLDRDNLGGFNASGDQIVQEVQTPTSGTENWGAGIWGAPAYWNNNLYFGGTNPGAGNSLTAYSYNSGVLSSAPTSQTAEQFYYPGPTPSISANGATNGILWAIQVTQRDVVNAVLLAYDATNLANLLYSTNANLVQDNPGSEDSFVVPTIANGKVYVGAEGLIDVYGLLGITPTAAAPVISPTGSTFTGSQMVTITDATAGASIYYTTNGTTPTANSKLYAGPTKVTATETITAIASATGYLQGGPVSATFYSTANALNPVFSLPAGSYSGGQSLTITAPTGSTIYYTVDGSTPTITSTVYNGPITVSVSEIVQAIATTPGLLPSSVVSAAYTITPAYSFNFSQGFAQSQVLNQMQFNGSTDLDDFRLQLTNGGLHESGSAFYTTPVNIQSFTSDFTFQLSNAVGDGITFTIQNVGPTALGTDAQGLGYAGINPSVAIYFNIHNNVGLGNDATGLFMSGSTGKLPTPAIDLNNTGINLGGGDYINAHITYDGTTLNLTLTDALTLATWSHPFPINIPSHVGGKTAYVGFTGSTGGVTASQKLTSWSYLPGPPPVPNYPAGFDSTGLAVNGNGSLSATALQQTDGGANETTSVDYSTPVDLNSFTTDFDFIISPGSTSTLADGFTFVIQNAGATALGTGSGGLGYATIPNSYAMKFDVFSNAGEGASSTGFYSDGAMPTLASINLTSKGVLLGSDRLFHAHLTYNGSVLTWSLSRLNTVLPADDNGRVTINIPQTIGGNTAYIGFTGSSGDGTALQQILDWTFSTP